MLIELEDLREACWEEFKEFLENLKPNIDAMFEALEKDDVDIISDQLSIVLTKLFEAYSKMRVLGILDEIGDPDLSSQDN